MLANTMSNDDDGLLIDDLRIVLFISNDRIFLISVDPSNSDSWKRQ